MKFHLEVLSSLTRFSIKYNKNIEEIEKITTYFLCFRQNRKYYIQDEENLTRLHLAIYTFFVLYLHFKDFEISETVSGKLQLNFIIVSHAIQYDVLEDQSSAFIVILYHNTICTSIVLCYAQKHLQQGYPQRDLVKHELRVASYQLRVEVQKCEFKSTSHESKSTSSNSRVTRSTLRVTSSNPRVTSLNSRVTSSNSRCTSSNLRVQESFNQ